MFPKQNHFSWSRREKTHSVFLIKKINQTFSRALEKKSFLFFEESTRVTVSKMSTSAQGNSDSQGISPNISINQTNPNLSEQNQNDKNKYIIELFLMQYMLV